MKIGILGCGHVSDQYFDGLAIHEALNVVACADLDRERAKQKAAQHGVRRVLTPDDLLADAEVELLVNLTPPQAHAQVSLAAIKAGKHVWSEKPLATNLEDARRLVDAAAAAGGASFMTGVVVYVDGGTSARMSFRRPARKSSRGAHL